MSSFIGLPRSKILTCGLTLSTIAPLLLNTKFTGWLLVDGYCFFSPCGWTDVLLLNSNGIGGFLGFYSNKFSAKIFTFFSGWGLISCCFLSSCGMFYWTLFPIFCWGSTWLLQNIPNPASDCLFISTLGFSAKLLLFYGFF